jgi:AmiR/NasT family two-component response regulator
MPAALSKNEIEAVVRSLGVLIVDDSQFMRKIVRNCLLNVGVKEIYEAGDGVAALEAIRTIGPDIVILECRCSAEPSSCASCAPPTFSRCRTYRSSC